MILYKACGDTATRLAKAVMGTRPVGPRNSGSKRNRFKARRICSSSWSAAASGMLSPPSMDSERRAACSCGCGVPLIWCELSDILSWCQDFCTAQIVDGDFLDLGRWSLDIIGARCRVGQAGAMQARLDPAPPHLVGERCRHYPIILLPAFAMDQA